MENINNDVILETTEPTPEPLVGVTAREMAEAIAEFLDNKRGHDI